MTNLRERTRRAVQKEIGDAALELFVARGYDATTIDDIAAAVGMSQRSVFRYFATKEEIVIGKIDLGTEPMLDRLRARPADEPVWTSLRRLFDLVEADDGRVDTRAVHRVVLDTPALLAVYLERLHVLQGAVVAVLVERGSYAAGDPAPAALTAAAFGCLVAAQQAWVAGPVRGSLRAAIDGAMGALEPRG